MNLRRDKGGMLDVELTCADSEIVWNALYATGVNVHRLRKKDEVTFECRIFGKEYKKMEEICNKKGASLRIKRKTGLFWLGKSVLRRPVFLTGLCVLALIACVLPSKVLFVRVEGNNAVPEKRILEAAELAGLRFGAARRGIRSEKMKNDLLEQIPQLRWAGINTSGCTAVISVRERMKYGDGEIDTTPANIIASMDGYILSGTAEEGTALFQPGQTVKAGQILISGYTDHGISLRASRARGEVYAQTRRTLEGITPSEYEKKCTVKRMGRKISLVYQKKRIILWKDSGISEGTCGRMYKEYSINLPGGFSLPVALCVETCYAYDAEDYLASQQEAEEILCSGSRDYMSNQMIAGRICEEAESVQMQEGAFLLHASYACTEMIGKLKEIQIGDTNGKID